MAGRSRQPLLALKMGEGAVHRLRNMGIPLAGKDQGGFLPGVLAGHHPADTWPLQS